MILQNVNMEVKPGERIGIIGESGAGKTTLIRMLLALTKPVNGSIEYIDEQGNQEIASPDARRFISYVPQGNTLITGTIAENLRIGNKDATEEMMWEAIRISGAERFVMKLPLKLDTMLGEKSNGISEGQAQRIAIARALICKKPVLILDEATSALDEKTEELVLKNISSQCENVTCFIITHRKSMLQYCDRVIQIQDGGISMGSSMGSDPVKFL